MVRLSPWKHPLEKPTLAPGNGLGYPPRTIPTGLGRGLMHVGVKTELPQAWLGLKLSTSSHWVWGGEAGLEELQQDARAVQSIEARTHPQLPAGKS